VDKQPKTGSEKWLLAYLHDRWQRIKRHPEFLRFWNDHPVDVNDYLALEELYRSEDAIKLRERFGLFLLHPPSAEFSPEEMLSEYVFENPTAVSYLWRTVSEKWISEDEYHTQTSLIWNDHFIRLEIDISPQRTLSEILDEVEEFVKEARDYADISQDKTRERFQEKLQCYQVWDMRDRHTPFLEIARELGIKEDAARKKYERAYELIYAEPLPDVWRFRARKIEMAQQHLLMKDPEKTFAAAGVNGMNDAETRLLLRDIARICSKCTDAACQEQSRQFRRSGDATDWKACPSVMEILSP
jgi:hypothetical protein